MEPKTRQINSLERLETKHDKRSNVLATTYLITLNLVIFMLLAWSLVLTVRVNDLENALNDISTSATENEIPKNTRVESSEKCLKELWASIEQTDISLEYKSPPIEYCDEQPDLSVYEMVPTCSTNTFRCMDYRTLTNHASEQWKLQMECYSDAVTGIRVYQKNGIRYFCAALGSAYGQNIGDAFNFTLENGTSFNVIYADFKNPLGSTDMFFGHPDTNYDGELGIGLLEFVYDKDVAPKCVNESGTMTALDIFGGLYGDGGNIAKIVYLGKVWNNDSSI